jgi:hypothetical protein
MLDAPARKSNRNTVNSRLKTKLSQGFNTEDKYASYVPMNTLPVSVTAQRLVRSPLES